MWEKLGEHHVDVLVVGGGINGAGIARDATRRGLSVALVEMRDLAYGTSSRSSKMVHGGLRYLEQFAFGLVFESVSERRILLRIAPHLVRPLGYIYPVFKGAKRGLGLMSLGMWVYEGLSLFRSPKRHRMLKAAGVNKVEPIVDTQNMLGAPFYYDCATDDARLTLESALDAAQEGAVIATWSRVTHFEKSDSGTVSGAWVENAFTQEKKLVTASVVVNATGPWTDKTRGMSGGSPKDIVMRTKGVHVVVDKPKLPVRHCVVCPHPRDGRGVYAVPWGDKTFIGTTDTESGPMEGPIAATLEDVDYLLEASNVYFPNHQVNHVDVISTWAGLRPLIVPESDNVSASRVPREHAIVVDDDGIVTVAGGKLTTYRKMSREVVDRVVKLLKKRGRLPVLRRSQTETVPLPGALNWPAEGIGNLVDELIVLADGIVSEGSARHLVTTYGVRAKEVLTLAKEVPALAVPLIPGRFEIKAQVIFAVRAELAASVTDFLTQRSQLFYRDHAQGLEVVHEVARLMGDELHWPEKRRELEIERYRRDVAHSRRWRTELESAPA